MVGTSESAADRDELASGGTSAAAGGDEAAPEETSAAADGDDAALEETEAEAPERASDLLQHAGRDAATLVLREVELATAQHAPELRRTAYVTAVALGAALTLLTAFALANWAAVVALSSVFPEWLAPLVLAAGWVTVGVVLLALVRRSVDRSPLRRWWRAIQTDPADSIVVFEHARDDARQVMGDSLETVTATLATQIGQAAVPLAGDAVTGAAEGVIDAADEISDAVEDAVPGGAVINRAVDIVLAPGRLGIRVTRAVTKSARR